MSVGGSSYRPPGGPNGGPPGGPPPGPPGGGHDGTRDDGESEYSESAAGLLRDSGATPGLCSTNDDDKGLKRELATVVVPPYPNINQLAQWKAGLIDKVAIASGREDLDKVTRWIARVFDDGVTLTDLANIEYKSYGTLDLKLLEGMVAMLEKAGERARMLRETINHERLEVAQTGTRLRGRQVVRLFMKSFRTFDNSEMMFDLTHLAKMECDPNNLHSFLVNWRHILDNQTGASCLKKNTEILRDPFYNKIKGAPELSRDITD